MTNQSKIVAAVAVAFVVGLAAPSVVIWNPLDWAWADNVVGRKRVEADHAHDEHERWTCAMHPTVILDEPGNCPICGMRLTKVASAAPPAAASAERKILYWRAPMDPNFRSNEPGKSPMGMDLIPVYEDAQPLSPGTVRVDPNFLQNFAVRTAVAEQGSIPIEIRTIGTLRHNEESVVSVNTKFDGYIEKAYRNNIGETVTKGGPLFDVYSPQLVTTQQEYLAALDYLQKLSDGAYPEAVTRAQALVDAGRERLRYWDVSGEEIARLDKTREVTRTVTVYAPSGGFIVGKMGDSLEGMRLMPGMTVLKIADHSRLWAEIELYEDDIRHVRKGTYVTIEARSFPGRKWGGRVVLFDTALDPRTRTLKAFAEIKNNDLRLRPEMFIDVVIRAGGVANAVTVPQQAVIHSGERSIVIVELRAGVFEPREVRLGMSAGERQEIVEGVEAGERIVTSSQFLIDSESNLRAAISQLLGDSERPTLAESEESETNAHANH